MKVLLALDQDRCSKEALTSLLERDWPEGSTCKLLHVVEPFEPPELHFSRPTKNYLVVVESIRKKRLEEAHKLIQEAKVLVEEKFSETDMEVIESFQIDQTILESANAFSADLIVVGSQRKEGLQRLLLGSVSHSVLLRATCSVCIYRLDEKGRSECSNVLVALDASEYSERAFDSVLKRPWPKETNFKLLTVIEPALQNLSTDNPLQVLGELSDQTEVKERLQKYLGEKAGQLAKEKRITNVQVAVSEGDPREVILMEIESWPAHQVFMGSQGKTALERLLIGSVSQAVASYGKCSVEVVR